MSFEEWNATSLVRVSGGTPTQIVTGVVTTLRYGVTSMSTFSMSPSSPLSPLSLFSSTQLKRTRPTDECWMFRSSRSDLLSLQVRHDLLLPFEKVVLSEPRKAVRSVRRGGRHRSENGEGGEEAGRPTKG